MDPHPSIETLFERAKQAFEHAQTFEQIRDAQALSSTTLNAALRRKRTAPELLQKVACLAIEVEYSLGQALSQIALAKAAPGNQHSGKKTGPVRARTGPISLRDLGISKNTSSRAKLLAKLSPDELRVYLVDERQQGRCPTLKGARLLAREKVEGGSAAKKWLHKRSKTDSDDPLEELLEHLKSVDNLLRDLYEGDTTGFNRAKGRLLKRYVKDSWRLGLEIQSDREVDGD